MKLSELLKMYRLEHDLSQRQFASMCELSNGYISLLEGELNPKTGKPITPTLPQLAKIANGMNLTLSELLSSLEDIPVVLSNDVVATPSRTLTATESKLLDAFNRLNQDGQQKATEYIEDLTGNDKYKKDNASFEETNIA